MDPDVIEDLGQLPRLDPPDRRTGDRPDDPFVHLGELGPDQGIIILVGPDLAQVIREIGEAVPNIIRKYPESRRPLRSGQFQPGTS